MKILFKIMLLMMISPLSLFGRELTLMHDKGGTPNYQPYFEEISKLTEKEIGVSYNSVGYVIAKCCEMFFVEMNEQSASNA